MEADWRLNKTETRHASFFSAPHWAPPLRYITLKRQHLSISQRITTLQVQILAFACNLRDPIFTQHQQSTKMVKAGKLQFTTCQTGSLHMFAGYIRRT